MKTHLRPHSHRGDGIRDHKGKDRRLDCKLGPDHTIHQLPEVPPEVRAEQARRLGESE